MKKKESTADAVLSQEFVRQIVSGKAATDAYIDVYQPMCSRKSATSLAARKKKVHQAEIDAMRAEVEKKANEKVVDDLVMDKVEGLQMATFIARTNLQDDPKTALTALKQLSEMQGWDAPQEVNTRVSVADKFDRERLLRIAKAQEAGGR